MVSTGDMAAPDGFVPPEVQAEITRAIDLIHREDDYEGGMLILCRLAGIEPGTPTQIKACNPFEKARNPAQEAETGEKGVHKS